MKGAPKKEQTVLQCSKESCALWAGGPGKEGGRDQTRHRAITSPKPGPGSLVRSVSYAHADSAQLKVILILWVWDSGGWVRSGFLFGWDSQLWGLRFSLG